MFSPQDLLAAAQGLFQRDVAASQASKGLGHEEGLSEESLQAARSPHHDLVLFRELLHPQDGDYVTQLLVMGQQSSHVPGDALVALAHQSGIQQA